MTNRSILWLRQDLRLHDQPALAAAIAEGAVIPLYILDDETPARWAIGAAQRWWLHNSLERLAAQLESLGSRLVLRRGRSADVLPSVAAESGTGRVHALRHQEPWWLTAEQEVAARLDLQLHDGTTLIPPAAAAKASGEPYKIYTPFWRGLQQHLPPPAPLAAPEAVPAPDHWPDSEPLESWQLLPRRPNWAAAFGEDWQPGEAAALDRLEALAERVAGYHDARNMPSEEGTSRFSPHLHFGELSPRLVWHRLEQADADKFRKELAWRDFARGMTLAYPNIGSEPLRPAFAHFPYRTGAEADADFRAWTRGETGYPIVDAGMRQLWVSGWMHNRVRMIAASFVVKHLLIDWRRGVDWFWDTLVDADYGNNGLNWQWIAGSGVDSNPFTRIMAPLVQSEKFDAAGYIRRWVPELAGLPDAAIHDPYEQGPAPAGYPRKIIGHREARARALAAFASFRD
jgi:deoxyribodipyrimidine photo-lyase